MLLSPPTPIATNHLHQPPSPPFPPAKTPPPQEVEDHLAEGLRFYMSLQDAVKQHQQQCSDYAYTRALQRDDLTQVSQPVCCALPVLQFSDP